MTSFKQTSLKEAPGQIWDNLCHINTMGYYLEIESNKLLILPTIWINFKFIMFNETKGDIKTAYYIIPLKENISKRKPITTETHQLSPGVS